MTLAAPPRRVPIALWLRLVLAGAMSQVTWWALAVLLWGSVILGWQRRNQPLGDDIPIGWMAVICLGACVPILVIWWWIAWRRLRMLRHGRETRGSLINKREVETSESSVWEYTFKYTVDGETKTSVVRTQFPEQRLEDDASEPMLYDPNGKVDALPLDHLPGHPTIDEHGQLVARLQGVGYVVIAPLLTLAALVATYVVHQLGVP